MGESRRVRKREGGREGPCPTPTRPRGAEDTFIMQCASEPAEPRGGYRRSTLPRNGPASRMRHAARRVRTVASRSSKVARLLPRGDDVDTGLIAHIRQIESWRAGNYLALPPPDRASRILAAQVRNLSILDRISMNPLSERGNAYLIVRSLRG